MCMLCCTQWRIACAWSSVALTEACRAAASYCNGAGLPFGRSQCRIRGIVASMGRCPPFFQLPRPRC